MDLQESNDEVADIRLPMGPDSQARSLKFDRSCCISLATSFSAAGAQMELQEVDEESTWCWGSPAILKNRHNRRTRRKHVQQVVMMRLVGEEDREGKNVA